MRFDDKGDSHQEELLVELAFGCVSGHVTNGATRCGVLGKERTVGDTDRKEKSKLIGVREVSGEIRRFCYIKDKNAQYSKRP